MLRLERRRQILATVVNLLWLLMNISAGKLLSCNLSICLLATLLLTCLNLCTGMSKTN